MGGQQYHLPCLSKLKTFRNVNKRMEYHKAAERRLASPLIGLFLPRDLYETGLQSLSNISKELGGIELGLMLVQLVDTSLSAGRV